MYDRVEQLLVDKAELNANHDGVPAAARHFHGACHELTMLLMQARDRLIASSFPGGPHRPRRAPLGAAPPAPPAPSPAAPMITADEPQTAIPVGEPASEPAHEPEAGPMEQKAAAGSAAPSSEETVA